MQEESAAQCWPRVSTQSLIVIIFKKENWCWIHLHIPFIEMLNKHFRMNPL